MANIGTKTFKYGKMGEKTVVPETRRGTTFVVIRSDDRDANSSEWDAIDNLHEDENFSMIKDRIQQFSTKTMDGLGSLRVAINDGDSAKVVSVARELTDYTSKMGAMRMMRLCIALQMVGRRDMFTDALRLAGDLESEFEKLKQDLVCAV